MKKILITNMVVLNGGDGAILFGMIRALRRAFGEDCSIRVYATRPDVAGRVYPEVEFRETLGLAAVRAPFAHVRYLGRALRLMQQLRYGAAAWSWARRLRFVSRCLPAEQRGYLREYAEADFIASGGGTYLKEEYGVVSHVCDYRLTLLLKRPLVFFTQSLGPFKRSQTRKEMKAVFSGASSILLRDDESRRNIEDLGLRGLRTHIAADSAFALADPAVVEAAKRPRPIRSEPRVAISVRHWRYFAARPVDEGMQHYRSSVAAAAEALAERGAAITFLSTCQGIPEYDDDAAEAERIVSLLPAEICRRITIVRDFIRFDEMVERLKAFDFCIATRMHMCILALISGTPVLPIAYEFKTRELFRGLGMERWVTDIDSICARELAARARAFQDAIPALRPALFEGVLAMHHNALGAGTLIRNDLEAVR